MAARQPPALMDELMEEILLRIPPDNPTWLRCRHVQALVPPHLRTGLPPHVL
jgi:hypothetical protein